MNKGILKYIKRGLFVLLSLYAAVCALLYFFQEKILFHPEAIPTTTHYSYEQDFTELFYEVEDDVKLNALLFQADSSSEHRKLVFYLHGNAENLTTAGGIASTYTRKGYDCFVYDYRGYGKSDGVIDSEARLFADAQILYSKLKAEYNYDEENITIVGYSIGTGMASWLAAKNKPKRLILQAPYFSMKDMMRTKYPIIHTSLLRYPLESNTYLKEAKCPVFIFHGDSDKVIPFSSSQKLKKQIPSIDLTPLPGLGHTGFMENSSYQKKLTEILTN